MFKSPLLPLTALLVSALVVSLAHAEDADDGVAPSGTSPQPAAASAPDTDGDGLLDPDDVCPDEAEDLDDDLDHDGCPDAALVIAPDTPALQDRFFPDVAFKAGKAILHPHSHATLDAIAASLLAHPNSRYAIAVHSDNRGNAAFNEQISRERAEAIRAYLVERGVDATRLSVEGWGEDFPVDDNDTAAGRRRNRRVEMRRVY